MRPKVSAILPCLNEEKTIFAAVKAAENALKGYDAEILVVDNGSVDNSAKIASKAGATVLFCREKGYGRALDFGLRSARGEIAVFADSDLSYPLEEMGRLVKAIETGKADICLGNRFNKKMEKGAMPFLNRRFGTPALSFLLRFVHGVQVYDCNSGMRALRLGRYRELRLKSGGMEYASEMLIRAAENEWSYLEVPIPFRKDQRGRPPHLRKWRDGLRHLRAILYSSKLSED